MTCIELKLDGNIPLLESHNANDLSADAETIFGDEDNHFSSKTAFLCPDNTL